jgi:AraC family transcriptional regulator
MLHSTSAERNGALAVASLLAAATVALDTDRHAAKSCIHRAAALLGIDLSSEGHGTAGHSCLHGGLALWKANLIKSYIEDKLDSSIRVTDLAGVAQLATSHFFRAFRQTFGESPIAYIMRRRIRRAQELMLKSRMPLSQVALECGMCDQAHLCRVFRRIVGINPTAWRRQFAVGPAPDGSLPGRSRFVQLDESRSLNRNAFVGAWRQTALLQLQSGNMRQVNDSTGQRRLSSLSRNCRRVV